MGFRWLCHASLVEKIARYVLQDNVTVEEAFNSLMIQKKQPLPGLEQGYRNFPGRIWLIPNLWPPLERLVYLWWYVGRF
jgi:hypothetical protein